MRKSLWKNHWLWMTAALGLILPGVVMRDVGVSWFGVVLVPGVISFFVCRHLQMLEGAAAKRHEPLREQERDAKLMLQGNCLAAFIMLPFVFWWSMRSGTSPNLGDIFYLIFFLFDAAWAAWHLQQVRRALKLRQISLPRW